MEAERQVILEEINMRDDEPADVVHELFHEALFPAHPLGREVLGERSTISAMTPEQIRCYFRARYRPARMVVAAAGNLDHDQVVAGVERRFRPEESEVPARTFPGLVPARPLAVVGRSTEQAHIVVGTRSLTRHDDDRFALSVLNQILGGGTASRLFQEIREQRGLAYSIYSFAAAFTETGAFAVYCGTTPSRAREVLDVVDTELDRLLQDGVTDRELVVAKGAIKGSLALSLEDSAGRMNRIGRSQLVHGRVLSFEEQVACTEAVGQADVERVVERVLGGDRVLAVVGPFAEDDFAERVA